MTIPSFNQDLIDEIFGEEPKLSFLGNLEQQGLSNNLEDFFRSRTNRFLDEFTQTAANQLMQGNLTTISPKDFFGGNFFRNALGRFSPETKGLGTGRFSPIAQYRF